MARREIPANHPPFAGLPVRLITVGQANERIAVHVAGRLGGGRVPIIAVPGYTRNMSDFSDFVPLLQRSIGTDWPIVLVDLQGRGRSSDRRRADDYSTTSDARDLAELARALAIEQAAFIGQGHGGQALMALAAIRPALIAAVVLVDAGPVSEPRSLIRMRSNAQALAGSRGEAGLTIMLRRMLAADYPALDKEELGRLAARSHVVDASGQALPLYDVALIERLQGFRHDDVLVPQWQLFDLLAPVPLLLARTELTDQLPLDVLEEMLRRRPDAATLAIAGQGSPALLDDPGDVAVLADFIRRLGRAEDRPVRRG